MKRVLSLVLALSMVLSMFSMAFAGTTLSDVVGTDYETAVSALIELGIVNGYEDGTYKPGQVVTRAEMAKLLVIAAGLEKAADVNKGATPFSDVAADHWASGYINVAAQYGYINGYPEGTFKPDATVTYAEAVTMAIRVLGYTSVVESKGTWPTNYIAKATELKTLKDVTYTSYNDGATRGNVALIIWNMLRTDIWDVTSENETNGLNYSNDGTTMIDKYFDDYTYMDEDDEIVLNSINIAEDGKVTVTLDAKGKDRNVTVIDEYELKAGDLLRLLEGMQVEALVNDKDEEVLVLTPVDKVIEGRYDAENEKVNGIKYVFENGAPEDDDYVVLIADGKTVISFVVLPEDDAEELDEEAIEDLVDDDEDLEVIYLIDGNWATAKDLEEGDVITEITADVNDAFTGESYFVVARNVVKGEYKGYITRGDDTFIEVDKKEYVVSDDTKYYEYNESKEKDVEISVADISAKDNKYEEEDVRLVCDYLDNVINVYFDEINKDTASKINFYVRSGNIWSTAGKKGYQSFGTFTNTNGVEDDYEFDADDVEEGVQGVEDLLKFLTNSINPDTEEVDPEVLLGLVWPVFEKNGKLYRAEDSEEDGWTYFATDDDDAVAEYAWQMVDNNGEAIMDKDTKYLPNEKKVTSTTKVVKISPVIDDDEVIRLDINVTSGSEEVSGVTEALVVVETKVEDDEVTGLATRVSYIFVAEDSSSDELSAALAKGEKENETATYTKNGRTYIKLGGTQYELDGEAEVLDGDVAVWTEKEDKVSIKYVLTPTAVNDEEVVDDVDAELITTTTGVIDTEADEDTYEDTTFILVNGKLEKKDGEKKVKFTGVKILGEGIDKADFAEKDRIVRTTINGDDVVIIIRLSGLKDDSEIANGVLVEEEEVTPDPEPTTTPDPDPTTTPDPDPTTTPDPDPTTTPDPDPTTTPDPDPTTTPDPDQP